MDPKELEALGSRNIRDDAPGGDPVRDEPEFEALQIEMRKLELPAGEQPDWAKVVTDASQILREKSQDLLVMAWLAVALLHRAGASGLRSGLTVIRDSVRDRWDAIYPEPKRVRGRVAAMDWLSERAGKMVAQVDLGTDAAEAMTGCLGILEELDSLFREKVEDGWNGMGDIRAALNEFKARLARPEPVPTAPSSSTASSAPAASSAGAVPSLEGAGASLATPADAQKALGQLRDGAIRLAGYLRSQDIRDPVAYRLPRSLGWAHLRQLPPQVDGKTQIPGFQPPDLAQKLEDAAGLGQWPGVLEQTEGRFPSAILWLDLHRYAASALEALGGTEAAEAIAVELAGLLRRLPGLEQLRFANDIPLADEKTRAWIREKVVRGSGEGGGAPAPASAGLAGDAGEDTEELPKVLEEARNLARRKQLAEALRLLEARAAACRTLRGKAAWKLEAGRLSAQNGSPGTAYGLLRSLDRELQSAETEAWEPGLGLDLAILLFTSHQAVLSSQRPPSAEEVAVTQELWGRLCRIDASAAAALEGRR